MKKIGVLQHKVITLGTLTQFQKDLITKIADGYLTKEIAAIYNLNPKTVDSYRTRILKSFGLKNGAHLVSFAYQHNLLTVPIPARVLEPQDELI